MSSYTLKYNIIEKLTSVVENNKVNYDPIIAFHLNTDVRFLRYFLSMKFKGNTTRVPSRHDFGYRNDCHLTFGKLEYATAAADWINSQLIINRLTGTRGIN